MTSQVWTTACALRPLIPCRGVGVLLPDGGQAALFRLDDGIAARSATSIVLRARRCCRAASSATAAGRDIVQSPIQKQAFALDDGACLDDPEDRAGVPTRVTEPPASPSPLDPPVPRPLLEWGDFHRQPRTVYP